MTDIENHMVVNLDAELDRIYGSDNQKDIDDMRCLRVAAETIIDDGVVETPNTFGFVKYSFDDVLQRTYEYTTDPRHPELHDYADCVKEILSLYPDSKLAKLVRHMAAVTAADALDIDL